METVVAPRAWVVGSSRSGSTWLTKMLKGLGAAVVDDPHLGHHLGVWRPISLAYATADEVPELQTLPDLRHGNEDYFFADKYATTWKPHLRDLIDARLRAQTGDTPAVVKDPGASGVAQMIFDLFPDNGMIWLVRDPRDVVASWIDAYGAEWGKGEGCYTLRDDLPDRQAFAHWQADVWRYRTEECRLAFIGHNGPKVMIHYEDLRIATAGALDYAASVARLQVTPDLIADTVRNYEITQEKKRGDGERVRRGEVGSWRELPSQEISIIEHVCGETMARVGY